MKKKNTSKTEQVKPPVKFCLECGEELNDFSLEDASKDGKSAKKQFHNCTRTGKFNGEMCSRVFIADFDESDIPTGEDPVFPEDEL